MTATQTAVLVVERERGESARVRQVLAGLAGAGLRWEPVTGLDQALLILDEGFHQVVMLEVRGGSEEELRWVARLASAAPESPLVAVTGPEEGRIGALALEAGADDFLALDLTEPVLVARVLRHVLERARLRSALLAQGRAEGERRDAEQSNEMERMEGLGAPQSTRVTSNIYSAQALSLAAPDELKAFSERYRALLETALEERAYLAVPPHGEALRALAQDLGALRAGPRDLILLHSATMNGLLRQVHGEKALVYLQEGRLLVLELMGYLAAFYRNYYPLQRVRAVRT